MTTLDALDEEALKRILTEPKNALVKQFQKLLDMDNVVLEFHEDALETIAKEAIRRGTGARGLRAIIEAIMLDVMYELPSRDDIQKCIITKAAALREDAPIVLKKDGSSIPFKRKSEETA
ncbi:hypothetical protein GCM10025858_04330 [Alicyclobacillus sacchari]|nr:hypothetical protein GCM10025858_04330 [Alicyclobacillus sacchari]